LTASSVKPRKALASTITVIAEAATTAVSASLVAVAIQGVGARGALLLITSGSTVSSITEATYMLHGIPRLGIGTTSFGGKQLLRPASASIIAVVGAHSTLASNTIITSKAIANSSRAITDTLVAALRPRMQVVGVHHLADPGEVLGASTQGAIRARPLRLSIETSEALAVVVILTSAVIGTVVLTKSTLAMPSLVPSNLAP